MLGYRRAGNVERLGQFTDSGLSVDQTIQNSPPDRVGEGSEGVVEVISTGNHMVTNLNGDGCLSTPGFRDYGITGFRGLSDSGSGLRELGTNLVAT